MSRGKAEKQNGRNECVCVHLIRLEASLVALGSEKTEKTEGKDRENTAQALISIDCGSELTLLPCFAYTQCFFPLLIRPIIIRPFSSFFSSSPFRLLL